MGSMVRHSLGFSLYEASFSQFFTRLETRSGNDPASQLLVFSAQPQPQAELAHSPGGQHAEAIRYFHARVSAPLPGKPRESTRSPKESCHFCLPFQPAQAQTTFVGPDMCAHLGKS